MVGGTVRQRVLTQLQLAAVPQPDFRREAGPRVFFPGGHSNNGTAHGIAGPLSMLALAALHRITVDGQLAAIARIAGWLDRWRTIGPGGSTWPYWVTRAELRAWRPGEAEPRRPSWCYGTAGQGRAQQIAALATGDDKRRRDAEQAVAAALSDPAQRDRTTDRSLCHGFAGLAYLAVKVAADAAPPTAERLQALLPGLLDAVQPAGLDPDTTATALLNPNRAGPGLLDGACGTALAVLATQLPVRSGWDTCLLTT